MAFRYRLFHRLYTLVESLSYRGTLEGLSKWHRRNVRSLSSCKEYDTDKPPVVGSPGGLHSTTFSHCPMFINNFCALQNGPPTGSQ